MALLLKSPRDNPAIMAAPPHIEVPSQQVRLLDVLKLLDCLELRLLGARLVIHLGHIDLLLVIEGVVLY